MTSHRARRVASDRGLAGRRGSMFLLWTLTFSTTVLIMVIGYFPMFQATVATSARTFRAEQALMLADAGAGQGVWQVATRNGADLNDFPEWSDFGATSCDDELDGGVDGKLYGTSVSSCFSSDIVLVAAQDNFGGNIGMYQAYIINFGAPEVLVIGVGTLQGATDTAVGERKVVVRLRHDEGFRFAAFGGDFLFLQRNIDIDSYNAANGPYDAVTNRFERGDIGTNGEIPINPGQLIVSSATSEIDGTAYVTQNTVLSFPNPWPDPWTSVVTQAPVLLPPVSLPDPAGYTAYDAAGNPTATPIDLYLNDSTQTCREPRRYNTLQVTGGGSGLGNFIMEEGCQLYLERPADSVVGTVNVLNTDGDGRFIVASNVTTPVKVFIKDGGFDLDGPNGLVNQTQQPRNFQLYATGKYTHGQLAQGADFYGVVYVQEDADEATAHTEQAGEIWMYRGSDSQTDYYGAFIAGGRMVIDDANTGWNVRVHRDESLNNLAIDGNGSGLLRYHVIPGSWSVQ